MSGEDEFFNPEESKLEQVLTELREIKELLNDLKDFNLKKVTANYSKYD